MCRSTQPELASHVVLSGASSITNATRQSDILGIVNSGFFEIVLGDIGDSFCSEVVGKTFEHFWIVNILNSSVEYLILILINGFRLNTASGSR